MGFRVDRTQPFLADMGIDLGRGQAGVAQQLLAGVAKEHLRLMVHKENVTHRVDNDDTVWSHLEERLGEYRLG